jgi:hypothetical protein
VQQHAASFIAHTEASTGAEPPRFIKHEFDAFLECGILAHGCSAANLNMHLHWTRSQPRPIPASGIAQHSFHQQADICRQLGRR